MSSVESRSNQSQANQESGIWYRSPNTKRLIETFLAPCCMLNRSTYSNISTSHHGLQPLGTLQVQSDTRNFISSEAEYVTKMIHCWTIIVPILMLKQSMTFPLPSGNAYIKSTMQDPNSKMLLLTQQNYVHSLKSI
jgi:hypothetical protein